tara:strand:- start:7216 stop:8232 length:1017 start_codon:yes stop_codon:yes gene_type:complete
MVELIECVPNFSEGVNSEIIDEISSRVKDIPGVRVLGIEPDPDYNRTVLTFAGDSESVFEGACEVMRASSELIDMREHQGEHPRIGAVDVCPFIPLGESSMEVCVDLAERLAAFVGDVLHLPAYLYGNSAKKSEHKLLSNIRKGEYESLEERFKSKSEFIPDFGPCEWNENIARFGATVIGAREILIAYNVNIDEQDARVAKSIGSLVRSSGRLIRNQDQSMRTKGLLEMVQGMGVTLEKHRISQVSMNLRNYNITGLHHAFATCQSLANEHETEVLGSEIVGLVPLAAMIDAGKWFFGSENGSESEYVEAAIKGLNLSYLEDFDPNVRIIEWAIRNE